MSAGHAVPCYGCRRASRGQALIETLALLPFGTAVLLGVLLLGRIHDIESRSIAAARYAAFLGADAPSPLQGAMLDTMATARTWAPQRAMIGTEDQWTERRFAAGFSPLWASPTDSAALLESAGSVATQTIDRSLAGAPGQAVDTALGAARVVGLLGRGEFDLANDGLLTATARVQLAPVPSLPVLLDQLDLALGDELAVLANSWSASGPQQVVARVQSLMPTSNLGRLIDSLAPIQSLVSLIEPEFRNLCVGHVDPEVVPPDRLGAPESRQRTGWRPTCRS